MARQPRKTITTPNGKRLPISQILEWSYTEEKSVVIIDPKTNAPLRTETQPCEPTFSVTIYDPKLKKRVSGHIKGQLALDAKEVMESQPSSKPK